MGLVSLVIRKLSEIRLPYCTTHCYRASPRQLHNVHSVACAGILSPEEDGDQDGCSVGLLVLALTTHLQGHKRIGAERLVFNLHNHDPLWTLSSKALEGEMLSRILSISLTHLLLKSERIKCRQLGTVAPGAIRVHHDGALVQTHLILGPLDACITNCHAWTHASRHSPCGTTPISPACS